MVVFGVAFSAAAGEPPASRQEIFDCAFTESHFYDATVDDVTEVFGAIASQIQTLRLVQ